MRALVRAALEISGRFRVVAEADDGAEGVRLAAEHQPELVLLDVAMPVMDGLEALPEILRAAPEAKVVVFSAGEERRQLAREALAAGAVAYLDKGVAPDAIVEALLAAAAA